ncbi:MAG TPA: hypothetical protein VK530_09465 [Candidatus Acidoferrum sp.]|nr:hypothetical protein [Candidatus Acidoferrum sp.]
MKRILVLIALLAVLPIVLLIKRSSPHPAATSEVGGKPDVEISTASTLTVAQRLALPRTTRGESGTSDVLTATNLLTRVLNGEDPPRISKEQAEAFAAANGRRPEALLAAWRASGDLSFLREAMEKHPQDANVAYMAWCQAAALKPGENFETARREQLEKFKAAAPDNALANYLSARDLFRSGDTTQAMEELAAGADKPWRDYTLDAIQNTEEAYRSAGFSEAEAKAIASMGALLPHLSELRATGKSLNELAATRREAGDTASADAALQWAIQLGQRTGQEGTMTLVQQLVAVAIERDTLKKFDPNALVDASGLTAQQRLAELEQRRDAIKGVAKDSGEIMQRLSEAELALYFDRLKMFGEESAVQWAKRRSSN